MMQPIFIGGTGRSGTTILRKVLARHYEIASFDFELRLITDSGGLLDLFTDLTENWSPWRADEAWYRWVQLTVAMTEDVTNSTYGSYALDKWIGPAYEEGLAHLRTLVPYHVSEATHWVGQGWWRREVYEIQMQDPDVFRKYLSRMVSDWYRAATPDAFYWTEDSPDNLLAYHRLRKVWPHMQFVMCLRHPFDILASFIHSRSKKRRWPSGNAEANAHRIRQQLEFYVGLELVRRKGKLEMCTVRLEDLVRDPEPVLLGLCDRLGVPDEYEEMSQPLDTNLAHVGRALEPVIGLDAEQLEIARRVLGPMTETLGYEAY